MIKIYLIIIYRNKIKKVKSVYKYSDNNTLKELNFILSFLFLFVSFINDLD